MIAGERNKRLFGRRKGRPLRAGKAALMQDLLPEIRLSPPFGDEFVSSLKGRKVVLEVGFGGGEHLAEIALREPDALCFGAEPFVNGVASLLAHIDKNNIRNIRIFPDDARTLIDALPPASVDACYVLFPDPWPKKRHAERRFINPENLDRLARVLKPKAELWMASDVEQLAGWMREKASEHSDFVRLYEGFEEPAGWIQTRYERKGKEAGRKPAYLCFARR
jgi:tRNA (guanine-N7-)-methyltransferase